MISVKHYLVNIGIQNHRTKSIFILYECCKIIRPPERGHNNLNSAYPSNVIRQKRHFDLSYEIEKLIQDSKVCDAKGIIIVLSLDNFLYAAGRENQLQRFSLEDPKNPELTSKIKFNDNVCKSMIITKNKQFLYLIMNNDEIRRIHLVSFALDTDFLISSVFNLFLSSVVSSNFEGSILLYQQKSLLGLTRKNLEKNRVQIIPNNCGYQNACLLAERSRRIIKHTKENILNIMNLLTSKRIDKTSLNKNLQTITVMSEAPKCYQILVSSWKKKLILFNTKGICQILQVVSIEGSPFVMNLSQDGSMLGIGGNNKSMMILEFSKHDQIEQI